MGRPDALLQCHAGWPSAWSRESLRLLHSRDSLGSVPLELFGSAVVRARRVNAILRG